MTKKTAVIGAGVGGLCTAARLSCKGFDVDVYEKLPECGGRAHIIEDKGFKIDTGPSFVLMPSFYSEIFDYCKIDMKDYLKLTPLKVHYKIFFPSGKTLTVHGDIEKTKNDIELFEAGAAKAFDGFINETGQIYKAVEPLLYKCFSVKDIFNPTYWGLLGKLKPFKSYWNLAKKYFKSNELCYAFTFEAMFIGVSPFKTPAFYSIITYADHVQKIFHPMGGMYTIPKSLETLAKNFGAKFNYKSEVKKILKKENGQIEIDVNGQILAYDNVVVNADWAYSQSDLLGRKLPSIKSSCSVFLIYLGLKQKVKGLEHHNLFFSKDLIKNLEQIFDTSEVPEDPSFYIHVPTVTDESLAPAGKEILYILIPVPNLADKNYNIKESESMLRDLALKKIKDVTGIDVEPLIEIEHKFYPQDFIGRYNVKYGATFGLAHTLMQSAFFRPSNVDAKIKGLYYVGASTQPGGGLPPVIASSRIVADLITS